MSKSSCIFCEICADKNNLIYEDKETVAFLDINPIAKGHVLVIPKKHFDTFIDCTNERVGAVNQTTQKIAKLLLKTFPEIKGFNILTNNGSEAYQQVFHYHVHVIPKYNIKDGLILSHGQTDNNAINNVKSLLKQQNF